MALLADGLKPVPLVGLVGPTAAGKSALALRLAERHRGEIVSCDSLQVYRGFDVGAAKPSAAERAGVPHHLIDVVEAGSAEPFSAATYAELARCALAGVRARGNLPLVVGGTGLYLRALLQGLFRGPGRDPNLRRRLTEWAERFGDARLHRLLAHVDPTAAARIAPRDRVRLVRALEVVRLTRRPLSEQQRTQAAAPLEGFTVRLFVLDPPRERLRQRVEARTAGMLAAGLVAEVRGLLAGGLERSDPCLRSIGYRQVLAYLEGRCDLASVQRDIVTATMRYAKRQRTWFRHQVAAQWFADEAALEAAVEAWLAAPGSEGR